MRNIPIVTKNLLIINVLAYIAQMVVSMNNSYGPDVDLVAYYGGLHFFLDPGFRIWQPLTYMFLHGSLTHLFFNMFALWMFGCTIERAFGSQRFLIYYLLCGIGAGVFQQLTQLVAWSAGSFASLGLTIGASGAVYGILLAFGMTFPNERIFIFPIPFPIKAKWFVVLYAVVELAMAMGSSGDGVAHLAHLGGMIVGFLLILYWRKRAYGWTEIKNRPGFFDKMKDAVERYHRDALHPRMKVKVNREQAATQRETDEEYNARKKAVQAEIDAILDKIRKSGYDSLTKEEKKKLFDLSHND